MGTHTSVAQQDQTVSSSGYKGTGETTNIYKLYVSHDTSLEICHLFMPHAAIPS